MKSQLYVIFAIVLTIIIAIFAVTNIVVVEVNYLFWTSELPLILVILFSVLMGGIIVGIAGTGRIIRLQKEIKALKLEIKNNNTQTLQHESPELVEEKIEEAEVIPETSETKE